MRTPTVLVERFHCQTSSSFWHGDRNAEGDLHTTMRLLLGQERLTTSLTALLDLTQLFGVPLWAKLLSPSPLLYSMKALKVVYLSLESTPIEYNLKWRKITTIVEVGGRMRELERSKGVEKSETWCDGEIGLSASRPRQFTSLRPNKANGYQVVKVRWHMTRYPPQ